MKNKSSNSPVTRRLSCEVRTEASAGRKPYPVRRIPLTWHCPLVPVFGPVPWRLLALSFLFLGLFTACGADETDNPEATELTAAPDLSKVTTGPLETRKVSRDIICTGEISVPPTDFISVHSRIAGQVTNLKYLPGDFVRKGAQLLRVSNPTLLAQQRELLEYRAQLATARLELERQETLDAGSATTAQQLTAARGAVELLAASYGGLKAELTALGVNVDDLERTRTFQSSIGVYAAGSGYVHAVKTNRGQMVSPDNELLQLASTEHLHLELSVPSREIGALQKGQTVTFQTPFDGGSGQAIVTKINPLVDVETATLNVHCHLEGKLSEGIVPGLFLNARIQTGERSLVGLPLSGVIREGDLFYGYRRVGEDWEKTLLPQASARGDFVTFAAGEWPDAEWVTGGAYYLAG